MNIDKIVKGRYVAINENPTVLCAYGDTASQAFKQMYKLLEENEDALLFGTINAVHTHFDYEDETHYVTVYI
jgi:hypothetical protein